MQNCEVWSINPGGAIQGWKAVQRPRQGACGRPYGKVPGRLAPARLGAKYRPCTGTSPPLPSPPRPSTRLQ